MARPNMRVTVDTAMRTRDVSQPHAEHELAARDLPQRQESGAQTRRQRPAQTGERGDDRGETQRPVDGRGHKSRRRRRRGAAG